MTTATRAVLNRDTVSGEALFILKNLRDNHKQGRSNKLAEVKTSLEPAVSLEFDAYFFFLRKFHYIAMDREAQLKLTDSGERVVEGSTWTGSAARWGVLQRAADAGGRADAHRFTLPFETVRNRPRHRRRPRGDRPCSRLLSAPLRQLRRAPDRRRGRHRGRPPAS
jgi:hypothetical protein